MTVSAIFWFLTLFTIQTLHTKFPTAATVKLVERVAHTTSFRPPELGIQGFQPLQVGVKCRYFISERHKRSILRLERGSDRYVGV
jgi:hypothetical protein